MTMFSFVTDYERYEAKVKADAKVGLSKSQQEHDASVLALPIDNGDGGDELRDNVCNGGC